MYIRNIWKQIRANEWWGYKLPVMLGALYMLIAGSDVPVSACWPLLLFVLVAIFPGAVYVSLLNDATDIQDDIRCGKVNHMAGRTLLQRVFLTLLPIPFGFALVLAVMPLRSLAAGCYAAAFLAFTLYSLPPFRLKARGWGGIMADALGSQVFPTLFMALYGYQYTRQLPVWPVVAALAVWQLCLGLRGILWHQLADRDNDVQSGLVTVIRRYSPVQWRRLGGAIVAVEMSAMAFYAAALHVWVVLPILCCYLFYNFFLKRYFGIAQVLLVPGNSYYRIFLFEYYQVFLPVFMLATAACKTPSASVLLLCHGCLFAPNVLHVLRECRAIITTIAARWLVRGNDHLIK